MSYQNVPGYFNFEILYSDIIRCAPPSSMLVEVGVWYGKSITFLAEQARIANKNLQLFAVDTWRGSTDQQGEDHDALEASYGGVWRSFLNYIRTEKVNDLITPMCLSSVEAAKYFENNSLFMVFIDGQHTYDAVKADILAWAPKIMPGGVLAGHDYITELNGTPNDVKRAVNELIAPDLLKDFTGCWFCQKTRNSVLAKDMATPVS